MNRIPLIVFSAFFMALLSCNVSEPWAENLPGRSLKDLCYMDCGSDPISSMLICSMATRSDSALGLCVHSLMCVSECEGKKGQCIGCM